MRVLHIITSLETGGAQWVMVHLIRQLKEFGYVQTVISMKSNGDMSQQINDLGIPLHEIPFLPHTFLRAKSRCEKIISSFQPDIIQSWLYHADFLTIFLRNPKKSPIIWGLHHSFELKNKNRLKSSTKNIVRINALFSKVIPRKIICCSRSAIKSHTRIGYFDSKMVYIPNGIDVNSYKPDPQSRAILRSELGLSSDVQLIGYIARYHPQKDHATFFNAADLLLETNENAHFVLAGDQVVADNPDIQKHMQASKHSSHFHFLGRRKDIPMIIAGLDVATLSSSGDEAFPLTILEAMACAIPCVATDVGDAKEIIGSSGIIVPAQNPKALSDGWVRILNNSLDERAALGRSARERILDHFTSEAMAKQYVDVYNKTR